MAGSVAYEAGSEEECRTLVRSIIAEKPDWIKIMITGGVLDATKKGEPGALKMPPAYVKACCEEAHQAGLRVAAHAESPEGVRVALENGVDTIEHGAQWMKRSWRYSGRRMPAISVRYLRRSPCRIS